MLAQINAHSVSSVTKHLSFSEFTTSAERKFCPNLINGQLVLARC
jgi:hypothetical protein